MSRELKTWVSDQLHTLVGFSEATLADYVCGMASKQRSVQGLLTALHEAEVPDNAATRRFASELWSRAPRQKATNADKARDKETIALNRHNDSYRPVEADEADEADEVTAAVQKAFVHTLGGEGGLLASHPQDKPQSQSASSQHVWFHIGTSIFVVPTEASFSGGSGGQSPPSEGL